MIIKIYFKDGEIKTMFDEENVFKIADCNYLLDENRKTAYNIFEISKIVFSDPLSNIDAGKKKDETPEDPPDALPWSVNPDALPWSMNQYRTVVDAIITLASVSGDLAILANNPKLEMSKELREELDELIYQLKRFDGDFTFEF